MSGTTKLFDYNTSFSVIRTNPKLSGNFRITIDSEGKVSLNSMSVNQTLSNDRFKNFNVTGENSFALDLFNFFDKGQLKASTIFQVGQFTKGSTEPVKKYQDQYDFFYASGASSLIDKNYGESFSYFAPLWLKSEIPDYFVIFKIPGPINYPYSKNQVFINNGIKYKLIQNYDSDVDFVVAYGKDPTGNDILYRNSNIFTGNSDYTSYNIISGSGSVVIFNELEYIEESNDVETIFRKKILTNANVIKTFDLGENTKIGKYIRSIYNDKNFTNSPVDVSFGPNAYTYYNGISVSDGLFTRKGEILYDYFVSDTTDKMIDFESYITDGFSRNGVVCPNLLNLEFLFDDMDSDLYTINRYVGFYVSRNEIAKLRLNGDYFYKYRDMEGNNDMPKPPRNAFGYYYDNESYGVTADTGVRLFYEYSDPGYNYYLPGSNDVNITDSNKLYYLTDKHNNFHTLKRDENYVTVDDNPSAYVYGPYDPSTDSFVATGGYGYKTGTLVLQDTRIDLLDFTGTTNKIATVVGTPGDAAGKAYVEIEFLKKPDPTKTLTFKIVWPNGSLKDGNRRYDIVNSGDYSATLVWVEGSYYSSGSSHYFNANSGTLEDVATGFANVLKNVDTTTWDSGSNLSSTIIRLRDAGLYGNTEYTISVFDDYEVFVNLFKSVWTSNSSYSPNDIVLYDGKYWSCIVNSPGIPPDQIGWNQYSPFSQSDCLLVNGMDASNIMGPSNFIGGTKTKNGRIIFPAEDDSFVKPGYFIKTEAGYSKILEISKYVDDPKRDPLSGKIIGFDDFTYYRVANIEETNSPVNFGSTKSFNTYSQASLELGVFTFFDVKEFDFDYWSSNYSYTPTPETIRYYQIQPGISGSIQPGASYLIKQGQIQYGPSGAIYPEIGTGNNLFIGLTGYSSFVNVNPDLFKDLIVFPAEYSDTNPVGITAYTNIGYNKDLDSFNGFIGIQSLTPDALNADSSKLQIFNRGKLKTEYEYLQENYTTNTSNLSRIVPFINKWGYSGGTDARGNEYRLNISPAFTPTNFSPSFDKDSPDSRYLTHEWFLLEYPPRNFPVASMQYQKSYLPERIDLDKARLCGPQNSQVNLYLSSYFTVESSDYPSGYVDSKSYTKELFTTFTYDKSSGYYETIFRGVKVVLKKRSNLSNSVETIGDKYIPVYRGYEDYKFAALLRPIEENSTEIQDPIQYEIIENQSQKFILFICNVVMSDYKSFPIGFTGGTGAFPIMDYTLLYSMRNKERLIQLPGPSDKYYTNADIKLSSALDLSVGSASYVNTGANGKIVTLPSETYDTDLREEINVFFLPNSAGATAGPSPIGIGSFYVNGFSPIMTYPWPTGVGQDYIETGAIATGSALYTFNIPFSTSSPATVPVGSQSVYKGKPVFQVAGGLNYYGAISKRLSFSSIAAKINRSSKYIRYSTYSWDEANSETKYASNSFELQVEKPSRLLKSTGSVTSKYFGGPASLGEISPTAYTIEADQNRPSILLRYSGGYEPLFRKVIHFGSDKTDKIAAIDLSFRNCTFAPSKYYFGVSRNLEFAKVALGNNILSLSQNLPEGPVYPLVGQSPIWKKDFNLFGSSWDPGYYEKFTSPEAYEYVAGTRSMKEYKSFFGSKMMQTPDPVEFDNYITLEINRGYGDSDINSVNSKINSFIKPVQYIDPSNSGTGIGVAGVYLSGVDYNKLDISIFPNAEIVWQYFPQNNIIKGIIRLDRMLSRYLINSGIKQVFIDNIISEFGVGNPDSIDDDVKEYVDLNVSPLYQGNEFDLYVNKIGTSEGQSGFDPNLMVRGDIAVSNKYQMEYFEETNYKLTKVKDLIYNFEYNLEPNYKYSLLFNLTIGKI